MLWNRRIFGEDLYSEHLEIIGVSPNSSSLGSLEYLSQVLPYMLTIGNYLVRHGSCLQFLRSDFCFDRDVSPMLECVMIVSLRSDWDSVPARDITGIRVDCLKKKKKLCSKTAEIEYPYLPQVHIC